MGSPLSGPKAAPAAGHNAEHDNQSRVQQPSLKNKQCAAKVIRRMLCDGVADFGDALLKLQWISVYWQS